MKIYNYDKHTGAFTFVSVGQVNPKRKNEYLMPPNSTIIAPPQCSEQETPVFKEGFWNIVADYRKQKQINLETLEVTEVKELGDIEQGYMLYSDYLDSDMYKAEQEQMKKDLYYCEIYEELQELDRKRVRAICEPSVKDNSTGETWLEYYNSQIDVLRQKLKEV